jgi:hypothetical protein
VVGVHFVHARRPQPVPVVQPVEEEVGVRRPVRPDGALWEERGVVGLEFDGGAVQQGLDGFPGVEGVSDELPVFALPLLGDERGGVGSVRERDVPRAFDVVERVLQAGVDVCYPVVLREHARRVPLVAEGLPDGVPGREFVAAADHVVFLDVEAGEDARVAVEAAGGGRAGLFVQRRVLGELFEERRRPVRVAVGARVLRPDRVQDDEEDVRRHTPESGGGVHNVAGWGNNDLIPPALPGCMNPRYALSEIGKHGTDRTWWRKRFLTHVVSRYFTGPGRPDADPVVDEDWDNLVILDACRYDLFEAVYDENPLPGSLGERTSVQSGTPGFLAENFGSGEFHDVVYVTGNPYVNTDLPEDTFHAVVSVWRDDWDDDDQTVLPDVMAERTLEVAAEYPDKRIISHFLQPHAPFVGDVRVGERDLCAIRERALGNENATTNYRTPFEMLEAGEASYDEVWAAYRSNLELAWPAVRHLLAELEGLTVVTSDHGNAMGERAWPFPIRVYGHPLGVLIPALTRVPWLTHRNGDRKEVTAEPPQQEENDVAVETKERLRMLGYAE